MAKFNLKVITPSGSFFEGEVDRLNIKTSNGYLGVMKGHIPLVANIAVSKMEIVSGSKTEALIHGGLLYVEKEEVTVISDAIELLKDINVSRAKQAKERAEKRVKSKDEETDQKRAELALAKAMARITHGK